MTPLNESTAPDKAGAPKEIWLQWNGDQEPDDDAEKHEVTWAANQIFAHDVRYVLLSPQPAPVGEGTTRTDAAWKEYAALNYEPHVVAEKLYPFARTLERELAIASRDVVSLDAEIQAANRDVAALRTRLTAAEAALGEALRDLEHCSNAYDLLVSDLGKAQAALTAVQSELGEAKAEARANLRDAETLEHERDALRHQLEEARKERYQVRKDYLDVADAIAPSSGGPQDLIECVRSLRRDKERLRQALLDIKAVAVGTTWPLDQICSRIIRLLINAGIKEQYPDILKLASPEAFQEVLGSDSTITPSQQP